MRSRKQRSEDDSHPVERVEHERGEPVQRPSVVLPLFLISSPSQESRRLPKVNTRLSTKEISGWGPRRMGYFISGSSRLSGELGEYVVEGERVFESPEKRFMTTDLVPAGELSSDVAMVPQNA